MKTFFQLCNLVLEELGLSEVQSFSDLDSTRTGKQIKTKIQIVNENTLLENNVFCRERKTTITVPALATYVSFDINGEIKREYNGIIDVSNKAKYTYMPDASDFEMGNVSGEIYCIDDNKILLASYPTERQLTVKYYTYDNAKDSLGVDKDNLELEDDYSIIPQQLQHKILVYGACYEIKKRDTNSRTPFWFKEFTGAKNSLRSMIRSEDEMARLLIGSEQYDFRRNLE